MELVYFIGNKKISYTFLSREEFYEIFGMNQNIPFYYYDNEKEIKIYKCDTSKTVVEKDGSILIFDNIGDFEEVQSDLSKGEQILEELLYKKNPYGKIFPMKTSFLIEVLLLDLGLSDIDEHNLYQIDTLIRNKGSFSKKYMIKYCLNIIALVGEFVIKTNTKKISWKMVLSEKDKVTWSPYLFCDNKQIPIFIYFFDNLMAYNNFEFFINDMYLTVKSLFK